VAEARTKPTQVSVDAFLKRATNGERLKDCAILVRIMKQAAGAPPVMLGTSIIGFASYPIQYAGGKTGAGPVIAFSPRKSDLTLYIGRGAKDFDALLGKLGTHKMSGGCLHIKRLSDVDVAVLTKLIAASVKARTKKRILQHEGRS
jgi:hypothetical protein